MVTSFSLFSLIELKYKIRAPAASERNLPRPRGGATPPPYSNPRDSLRKRGVAPELGELGA